jgi:hypothetical protein
MIENEDAHFQRIIDFGGGIPEYGGYIDLRFLSDAGMVNFINLHEVELLTPAILSNLKLYFGRTGKEEGRWTRFRMPFDSKIISTVPSILEDISNKQ